MRHSYSYYVMAFFAFTAYAVAAYAVEPDPFMAEQAVMPSNAPKQLYQLSYGDAETAISHALSEKGAGTKVSASITAPDKTQPLFSCSKPIHVEIRGLTYDKRANKWGGSLFFIGDNGDVVSALPATGQFEEMEEVPVLKREVRGGEVIQNNDVEIRDFPIRQTRTDSITDISDLIGKAPIRTISPNRPIRGQEVSLPVMIKKNRMVEIRFTAPGMEITTSGQAMNDGAKGDVINVRNTTSRRVVRAMVQDANTVDVLSPNEQASQMTEASHAEN